MSDERRQLPPVHSLLSEAEGAGLLDHAPRQFVIDSIRTALDEARREGGTAPKIGWMAAVEKQLERRKRGSLIPVVNATGVVLHTNIGRAPLARVAVDAAIHAYRYNTLELDLESGERGSRQEHLRPLLTKITGAEDGLVVNNAASALFLLLHAIAAGGETVVSRGELVEIGGSFRIPEILASSGSALVEVGTTNRTRVKDYLLALSPRSRLLLKVHRSNFTVRGFVDEVTVADLVALGKERNIPVAHDAGSGLLVDLSRFGLSGEPRIQESVAAGSTVVFSGDKLLGGPQAGIIVGPTEIVSRVAANPLARALRPDKFTIAALEATLSLYRDPESAISDIPTLRMLTATVAVLQDRAGQLCRLVRGAELLSGTSAVGGGAYPGVELATWLVAVRTASPDDALVKLREHDPPILARAGDGCVLLDVRTIDDEEFPVVAAAVRAVA